ncbi:MAG TPA: carbohydrate kinase [Pseudolysinimonas sp.]|jgi:fructokinase|nr:carbohydrate kinase [Pseudolysinimonas sp.]
MPHDDSREPQVLVIGEALVDIVDDQVMPGGSPLNVAVGLQRLGVRATLHSSFGADPEGVAIAQHLEASGVTVTPGTVSDRETSVARATIGADGAATYDFSISWDPGPVDTAGYALVHTGSIGAALEPGATTVEKILSGADALISFDPNVRPALMGDHAAALARVERFVALADIVKASDEDVAWLYPDATVEQVLERWHSLGARLVVATRGAEGADALSDGGPVHVPAFVTTIADTIGAGDSFMSGLLAAVLRGGFDDVAGAVTYAARCAGITVSRPGADPPRADEVSATML